MPSERHRLDVAYLFWCIDEGYLLAEDRAVGEGNWMLKDDDQLQPDDIESRRGFLEVADAFFAGYTPEPESEQIAALEAQAERFRERAESDLTRITDLSETVMTQARQIERLQDWKSSAMVELMRWYEVGEAMGDPAPIGGSRVEYALRRAKDLMALAHDAWHLMDDSGEMPDDIPGLADEYVHSRLDHAKVSDALDVLEGAGWEAHPNA